MKRLGFWKELIALRKIFVRYEKISGVREMSRVVTKISWVVVRLQESSVDESWEDLTNHRTSDHFMTLRGITES